MTKYHELGGLNNRLVSLHSSGGSVFERKVSLRLFLLRAERENLFLASLLASGGLLAVLGVPWLLEASPASLPSSSHDILPVRVSVSLLASPLLLRPTIVFDEGPILLHHDFILTNCICSNPRSEHVHVLSCWESVFQFMNLRRWGGGRVETIAASRAEILSKITLLFTVKFHTKDVSGA